MFPLRDNTPRNSVPVVTTLLVVINVMVFLFEVSLPPGQLERFVELFGLVPKRFAHPPWAVWVGFPADQYWPILTHMFVHGSLLHLFSNLWILWIFGDNVEDRMGHVRFVIFYVLCGLVAGAVHLYTNHDSTLPVVGASGAIAGVLGAYFVLYPRARLVCVLPIFFYPLFFEVPAFVFLILWFLTQLYSGALSSLSGQHVGGVAWWAHVGGFAAGVLLHWFFLARRPAKRRMYADEYGVAGPWARR
jgi:membrane associated rhomboid family serine protease